MATDTKADALETVMLDTSAAVALVVEDHEAHSATLEALRGRRLGLAGHAWFETYSVLTRLPPGLRRSPDDVYRLLTVNFPESGFLDEAESADLGRELPVLGIAGGSVYDALVATAARAHQRILVSGDARALPVYESLGIMVKLIPFEQG